MFTKIVPPGFFLLAFAIGCSGEPTLAPVSGVITLNGTPYGDAVVSFQPLGTKANPNPGRGSSAYTDKNGRFVLKSDDKAGAVVGKHLVRIMTKGNVTTIDPTKGSSPDEVNTSNRKLDPIPPEWNSRSDKEFDVPVGGTDKANFNIESQK